MIDITTAGNQKFMAAFADGASAMSDLYTDDAKIYPPGGDTVSGKSTIGSFWKGAYDAGIKRAKLETVDADAAGDQIVEMGHYTLYGDGDMQIDTGKYMVVWKQEGGDWKLHRDIWNTSVTAQ